MLHFQLYRLTGKREHMCPGLVVDVVATSVVDAIEAYPHLNLKKVECLGQVHAGCHILLQRDGDVRHPREVVLGGG